MLLAVLVVLGAVGDAKAQYEPNGCSSTEEDELASLVNAYRAQNGLSAVPVSTQLTLVAQWHVQDSAYAKEVSGEFGSDPSCNLHSWYGTPTGPYSTCCYTSDHAQAACMWDKPEEISGGTYTPTGFENAAYGYSTPSGALNGWAGSPGHNDVILNQGAWASHAWQAMGVGVGDGPDQRFYYLWFSEQQDPVGTPNVCPEPSSTLLTASALAILAILLQRKRREGQDEWRPSAARRPGGKPKIPVQPVR
jgi:hypothetical protein